MTPVQRPRQISLSRSTPNLTRLDPSGTHSPAITIDEGTPRSPPGGGFGLPSPPSSQDRHRVSTESQDADEEDEYTADFMIGSDDLEDDDDEDDDDEDEEDDSRSTASATSTSATSSAASSAHASPGVSPTATRVPAAVALLGRRSQSHAQLASFAPPFYNRPPLPLPPSPSLTSLLRPSSFSATPSRPTTPDDSENDTPNDTEAAVGKAARAATTVPRAAPQVPTYEYYGFVLYLTSSAAFVMYVLWSFLPSPFLHALGIDYYPNRWWSLAAPAQLVATIVYIYVALACYNTEVLTLPLAHPGCLVDEAAQVAVIDPQGRIVARGHPSPHNWGDSHREKRKRRREHKGGGGKKKERKARVGASAGGLEYHRRSEIPSELDWREVWNKGTDAVMDVPIGGVCEILYGQ